MNDLMFYEKEGAMAACQGKTREDCPYDQETQSDQWNFWVYGNENQQGSMLKAFMTSEGTPSFFTTTADLTPEMEERMMEWGEKCDDATKRMRAARGWKPV